MSVTTATWIMVVCALLQTSIMLAPNCHKYWQILMSKVGKPPSAISKSKTLPTGLLRWQGVVLVAAILLNLIAIYFLLPPKPVPLTGLKFETMEPVLAGRAETLFNANPILMPVMFDMIEEQKSSEFSSIVIASTLPFGKITNDHPTEAKDIVITYPSEDFDLNVPYAMLVEGSVEHGVFKSLPEHAITNSQGEITVSVPAALSSDSFWILGAIKGKKGPPPTDLRKIIKIMEKQQ